MKKQPPRAPGKTLLTGFFGSLIAIPLMPIIIPIVIFYYFGQILGILFGKGRDQ